jgi:hypothetical protein
MIRSFNTWSNTSDAIEAEFPIAIHATMPMNSHEDSTRQQVDWCEQHLGDDAVRQCMEFGRNTFHLDTEMRWTWGESRGHKNVAFFFREENDAFLFKMKFAGEFS